MITSQFVAEAATEVLTKTVAEVVTSVRPAVNIGAEFTGTVAMLSFGGAETGTLYVLCDRQVACALAGKMLGLAAGDLDDAIVADAIGEIANQMAGTISRRISGAGTISLTVPMTASGDPLHLQVFRSAEPAGADIVTSSGTVHLRYCERQDNATRHAT